MARALEAWRRLLRRWDSGVWRRPDFRALFAAQTGSVFGTLISRTAIPFAAIIELGANALQLSLLGIATSAPAFGVGLFAGAWVDRLPRKPIMIASDLIRAGLLLLIPLLWALDRLSMPIIYVIVATISICTVFFDIAYRSILPTIVSPDELLDGNSRLTGASSVAEAASFSLGGWLVQAMSAPFAVAINAVTFIWSARWLLRIEVSERVQERADRSPITSEILYGLRFVWANRTLRALAIYSTLMDCAFGLFGTVFMLFVVRELGFEPGALGLIFALGGIAAIGGAAVAGRITGALGFRKTIMVMTIVMAIGQGSVVLATGVTLFAVLVLIAQQFLVDGPYTIVDVDVATMRQLAAEESWQGRINSTARVLEFGGGMTGTIAAGLLAGPLGVRAVMLIAAGLIVANGLIVSRVAEPDLSESTIGSA